MILNNLFVSKAVLHVNFLSVLFKKLIELFFVKSVQQLIGIIHVHDKSHKKTIVLMLFDFELLKYFKG